MSSIMHFRAEDIIGKGQWLRGNDWYLLLGFLCRDRVTLRAAMHFPGYAGTVPA